MTGSRAGSLIVRKKQKSDPQRLKPVERQALNVEAKAPPPGAKHFFSSLRSSALTGRLTGNWAGGVTGTRYSVELEAC
jgi:hypothetical protein